MDIKTARRSLLKAVPLNNACTKNNKESFITDK